MSSTLIIRNKEVSKRQYKKLNKYKRKMNKIFREDILQLGFIGCNIKCEVKIVNGKIE